MDLYTLHCEGIVQISFNDINILRDGSVKTRRHIGDGCFGWGVSNRQGIEDEFPGDIPVSEVVKCVAKCSFDGHVGWNCKEKRLCVERSDPLRTLRNSGHVASSYFLVSFRLFFGNQLTQHMIENFPSGEF